MKLPEVLDKLGLQELKEKAPEPKCWPVSSFDQEAQRIFKNLAQEYAENVRVFKQRVERSGLRKRIETISTLLGKDDQQKLTSILEEVFSKNSQHMGKSWGGPNYAPLLKLLELGRISEDKIKEVHDECLCAAEKILAGSLTLE